MGDLTKDLKNGFVCDYSYEEIEIGQTASFEVTITERMRDMFRDITGDVNPLHNDLDYAKELGHENCVAFGMLTASFLSTFAGVYLPGKRSLINSVETKFERPVYIGDTIKIEGKVVDKNDTFKLLEMKIVMKNQSGKKVCKAKMTVMVS